jgi:hydrogenase/urease accessory protein HupE
VGGIPRQPCSAWTGRAQSEPGALFEHILLGVDHLLFVLGLLLIVADRWVLVKTITAFTVAHSITLAVATLGYASAPGPPLNAAIALSILFLGPEVVRRWRGETSSRSGTPGWSRDRARGVPDRLRGRRSQCR